MATTERIGDPIEVADTDSDSVTPLFVAPPNVSDLLAWLDEQPLFVEFEHSVEVRRDSARTASRRRSRLTRQHTGQVHVPSEYERTDRKSFDSQGDVAEAWAEEKFPDHNIVSTEYGDAAELYTLSSYQVGVDGPSQARRVGLRRTQEVPAAAFACSECDQMTSTFDPDRRRSGKDDKRRRMKEHVETHTVDASVRLTRGQRVTESEKNYTAYQHLDGAGHIEHYSTLAAIRSRHGVVLANGQDFAKGRARVTYPPDYDAKIPLSGTVEYLEEWDVSVFDTVDVETVEVEASTRYRSNFTRTWYLLRFENGAAFAVVYDSTAQNYHEKRCGFYLPPEQAQALDAERLQTDLRPVEVSAYLQRAPVADVVGSHRFTNANGAGHDGRFYTDEMLGRDVIRQGEWFFIPLSTDFTEALAETGLHDPEGAYAVHDARSLPSECSVCDIDGFRFEWRLDGVVECKDCGSLWFIDGHVGTRAERNANPLGSHRPAKLRVVDGHYFVRGMIRHDTRDHNAINLDDVWHLAIDNGRDGVVFNTKTPESASGRSGPGSMMRVE